MGRYSVPAEIRAMKPKGTMVKAISGHYYVYEYRSVREGGRRRTEMGRCIGRITEAEGFVSNAGTKVADSEVTCVEFGQHAVAMDCSKGTPALLRRHFARADADRIYACALIHFVEGFQRMGALARLYEMSVLSLRMPGLKMGYDALAGLYGDLGRRQGPVLSFEQALVDSCSGEVAVDGHVIGSRSLGNSLAEKGYRLQKLGEPQVSMLMAYDVRTGMPLLSRMYEGGASDAVSVRDLFRQAHLAGMLFLADRGFLSEENLALFTADGNQYVIPLPKGDRRCRASVALAAGEGSQGRFVWMRGRKACVVEWRDDTLAGRRVLHFRDLSEQAEIQANYLRHMEMGTSGYTQEGLDAMLPYMGVTVLQTSLGSGRSAQEIWSLYKRRWSIETFFDYFKNGQCAVALGQQDYCREQGLAFVLLVSALIMREVSDAAEASGLGMSVGDILLDARMVKACRRFGKWEAVNCKKKRLELFAKMKTGLEVVPRPEQHT